MRPHFPHDEGSRSPADLRLTRADGTAVALRWRAFGDRDDLDLDFRSAARTRLVTELLARCRRDVSGDIDTRLADARRLTLSGRIGGLAAIVARTVSSSDLVLELRCPIEGCQSALQVSLSLVSLLELSQHAEGERSIAVRLSDAESVDVRRPTGDDQHTWQAEQYHTMEAAERAMVESLLVRTAPLSSSTLAAIDSALEEADPLTCFRMTTVCPTCEEESDYAMDLEALLLARLHVAQRVLLYDIHRLATRYGWSEKTIAALPSWRRREYLDFIDRGNA
jgi:hypothetical protein